MPIYKKYQSLLRQIDWLSHELNAPFRPDQFGCHDALARWQESIFEQVMAMLLVSDPIRFTPATLIVDEVTEQQITPELIRAEIHELLTLLSTATGSHNLQPQPFISMLEVIHHRLTDEGVKYIQKLCVLQDWYREAVDKILSSLTTLSALLCRVDLNRLGITDRENRAGSTGRVTRLRIKDKKIQKNSIRKSDIHTAIYPTLIQLQNNLSFLSNTQFPQILVDLTSNLSFAKLLRDAEVFCTELGNALSRDIVSCIASFQNDFKKDTDYLKVRNIFPFETRLMQGNNMSQPKYADRVPRLLQNFESIKFYKLSKIPALVRVFSQYNNILAEITFLAKMAEQSPSEYLYSSSIEFDNISEKNPLIVLELNAILQLLFASTIHNGIFANNAMMLQHLNNLSAQIDTIKVEHPSSYETINSIVELIADEINRQNYAYTSDICREYAWQKSMLILFYNLFQANMISVLQHDKGKAHAQLDNILSLLKKSRDVCKKTIHLPDVLDKLLEFCEQVAEVAKREVKKIPDIGEKAYSETHFPIERSGVIHQVPAPKSIPLSQLITFFAQKPPAVRASQKPRLVPNLVVPPNNKRHLVEFS